MMAGVLTAILDSEKQSCPLVLVKYPARSSLCAEIMTVFWLIHGLAPGRNACIVHKTSRSTEAAFLS